MAKRDPMAIVATRLILGCVFIAASVEDLGLLPTNIVPESADIYIQEITGGGVLAALVRGIQLAAGAMIAFNFLVPMALLVLAPVMGNIFLYSLAVNQANLAVAIPLLAAMIALVYFYRRIYGLFLKVQYSANIYQEKTPELIIIDDVERLYPEKADILRKLNREMYFS